MKKTMLLLIAGLFSLNFLMAQSATQEAMGIDQNKSVKILKTSNKSISGIPAGGLLLVPESLNDRVIALDPETGDVIDEMFIDGATGGIFSTPIKVVQKKDKSSLYVSDQVADAVFEFDNDGNYLGLFAPAGGTNPSILDNVRGFCYRNATNNILVCDGNNDAVQEFDIDGNFVTSFTSPGLVDPFDIIYWPANDQYLVCDISGGDDADAIKVFDNAGNYVSDFATGIDFPEQISLAPGGNILVATFSAPSGIYEYLPNGTLVNYYDAISGCRGVYELPNGNMLVTSGDAIYELSKSNTVVDTKFQASGASLRFVTYVAGSGANVTFRVDMSQQTVPPEGVHIAGSFQGWDPGATAMTDMGNGIYSYTHTFAGGEYIEYKFINGDEWGEDEAVPSGCAQNNNRYLDVPLADTLLPAVCFASCQPCGNATEVTIQVDMSEQTVSGDGVHVAGSFQGWNPSSTEMLAVGNGVYEVTVTASEGETIEYKFINGNDWAFEETVPSECGVPNGVGGYNRYFEVPTGGGNTDLVCFASCDPCGVIPVEVNVTFQVDMSQQTVSGDGIHLAGDFQGWDPAASGMTLVSDDVYQITFPLVVGSHHQFKFINGNSWDGEETVPEACGEDNGSGGYNRFIDIPDSDTLLPAYCFGSCDTCMTLPDEHSVTFRVDMSDQTVSADGVHIAGDFQGWDPGATAMNLIGNSVYAVEVMLYEGFHYQYKFINGNSWDGEETVPEACGEDNGNGGYNRFLDVPAMDTTLVALCFSSCDTCVGTYVNYEKLNGNIAVSPNPFLDEIWFVFAETDMKIDIKLINSLGVVVASDENIIIRKDENYTMRGLSSLAKGIYFLNISTSDTCGDSEMITKKLIKK